MTSFSCLALIEVEAPYKAGRQIYSWTSEGQMTQTQHEQPLSRFWGRRELPLLLEAGERLTLNSNGRILSWQHHRRLLAQVRLGVSGFRLLTPLLLAAAQGETTGCPFPLLLACLWDAGSLPDDCLLHAATLQHLEHALADDVKRWEQRLSCLKGQRAFEQEKRLLRRPLTDPRYGLAVRLRQAGFPFVIRACYAWGYRLLRADS